MIFLRSLFPTIFNGPKTVRNFKLTILLSAIVISITGLTVHVINIWAISKHGLLPFVEKFCEDFGLNILVGLLVFAIIEFTFQNIEKKYGLVEEFSYDEIIRQVKDEASKKSEVKILSIFLRVFTPPRDSDYKTTLEFQKQFNNYFKTREDFKSALINACKNDKKSKQLKVSILLLDPMSFSAIQRREELNNAGLDINIIHEIIATLQELVTVYEEVKRQNRNKNGDLLSIKIYSRTPPFSLFAIDQHYSFTFYSRGHTIRDIEHYTFYEGTPFQRFVTSVFNEVWTEDSTFDLDNYLYLNFYSKNGHVLKDIFYIDCYKHEWFPEKKYIIFLPNDEQLKKLKDYTGDKNEVIVRYRGKKRFSGKICQIENELPNLRFFFKYELIDYASGLVRRKYPASMADRITPYYQNLQLIVLNDQPTEINLIETEL